MSKVDVAITRNSMKDADEWRVGWGHSLDRGRLTSTVTTCVKNTKYHAFEHLGIVEIFRGWELHSPALHSGYLEFKS